jgi:hypothetical protein
VVHIEFYVVFVAEVEKDGTDAFTSTVTLPEFVIDEISLFVCVSLP